MKHFPELFIFILSKTFEYLKFILRFFFIYLVWDIIVIMYLACYSKKRLLLLKKKDHLCYRYDLKRKAISGLVAQGRDLVIYTIYQDGLIVEEERLKDINDVRTILFYITFFLFYTILFFYWFLYFFSII